MQARSVLYSVFFMLAGIAGFAALAVLARYVTWNFGGTTPNPTSRFNSGIAVFSAIALTYVVGSLIAIYIDDVRRDQEQSPIYTPIMVLAGVLWAILAYVGIGSLVNLRYEMPLRHWTWRLEPEVQLIFRLLYLAIPLSFCWFISVVLYRRGTSLWVVWGLFGGLVALSLLALLVALAV